ncbi:RAFTIN 1B protein [Nymphaea thermarum]|nr:RAFTIN 1B protein [Nymphaea thermarum]
MANFIPFLFFLSALMLVGAGSSSKEMSPVGYWNKLLPKTPIPMSLDAFLPKAIMSEIPHRHMPAHQMILQAIASTVKQSLEDCEMEANKGETKYCATSLESMVDFAMSQLKTNDLQLLNYSFVNKEEREPKSRVYTVQPGVVELPSSQAVACHIEPYPYAVFHCHIPMQGQRTIPLCWGPLPPEPQKSCERIGRSEITFLSYPIPSIPRSPSAAMAMTLFFFLSIVLLGGTSSSSGEMSPEAYWKKLLPRTPIPDSLQPFLPKDLTDGVQKEANVPVIDKNYVQWRSGVTPEELKTLHDTEFLFLTENLNPGSKTNKMDFVKKEREGRGWHALLPRRTAEAFPFSVSKLDSILKYFSIEPTSTAARYMKETLAVCEEEANEGETRYCATSLESMVDFAISQLKTNDVRLLSTSILDKGTAAKGRVYTVQKGVTEFPYKDSVVCHVLGYPYAVFYCHKTINTSSYVVPLVAEEDGSRVDAGAVCHTETSSWNPKHATFQTLGVKPGVPIRHFLPYGHFTWVANSAP